MSNEKQTASTPVYVIYIRGELERILELVAGLDQSDAQKRASNLKKSIVLTELVWKTLKSLK